MLTCSILQTSAAPSKGAITNAIQLATTVRDFCKYCRYHLRVHLNICVHTQKYSNEPFVAVIHRYVFSLCILMRTRDLCYYLIIMYSVLVLRYTPFLLHNGCNRMCCSFQVSRCSCFNFQLACCRFYGSSIVVVVALLRPIVVLRLVLITMYCHAPKKPYTLTSQDTVYT